MCLPASAHVRLAGLGLLVPADRATERPWPARLAEPQAAAEIKLVLRLGLLQCPSDVGEVIAEPPSRPVHRILEARLRHRWRHFNADGRPMAGAYR
jgi:hypothetical protein